MSGNLTVTGPIRFTDSSTEHELLRRFGEAKIMAIDSTKDEEEILEIIRCYIDNNACNNMRALTSLAKDGVFCGYDEVWIYKPSVIRIDKFTSSDLDIHSIESPKSVLNESVLDFIYSGSLAIGVSDLTGRFWVLAVDSAGFLPSA